MAEMEQLLGDLKQKYNPRSKEKWITPFHFFSLSLESASRSFCVAIGLPRRRRRDPKSPDQHRGRRRCGLYGDPVQPVALSWRWAVASSRSATIRAVVRGSTSTAKLKSRPTPRRTAPHRNQYETAPRSTTTVFLPNCSEAMPPQARIKSPVSVHLSSLGAGELRCVQSRKYVSGRLFLVLFCFCFRFSRSTNSSFQLGSTFWTERPFRRMKRHFYQVHYGFFKDQFVGDANETLSHFSTNKYLELHPSGCKNSKKWFHIQWKNI